MRNFAYKFTNETTEPTMYPPRQQSFENERIGQRRRGWVDDEDDAPRRLPLVERRRPVNGVLVRYFRFSHCAAFIISSYGSGLSFFLVLLLTLSLFR